MIGISFYLGDLADKVFRDSLMFPFALSLIGVAVIALGLLYYRHQDRRSAAWLDDRPAGGREAPAARAGLNQLCWREFLPGMILSENRFPLSVMPTAA